MGSLAGVLDHEREEPGGDPGGDLDHSPFQKLRHPVADGVLDQGLEDERRNEAALGALLDFLGDGEAVAEADPLDREVARGVRQLLGERRSGC
jgi:hypothetical protein